jgi:membrane protease YdiL (CAAX protease family)
MTSIASRPRPNLARRIVLFPLSLIIIGCVCVFTAEAGAIALMGFFGQTDEANWWPPFVITPALVLAYVLYVRLVERRPVDELGQRSAYIEFGAGYLLGAALFTSVILVLGLLGVFHIVGRNPAYVMVAPFFWLIMHAVSEELVFRGLIFRLVEGSLGSVAALLISAAIFGAAHGFNPGATVMSTLAISIEAGVLLGVAFMLTRRLWLCIGIHAAWNFVQGGVFSVPVSGTEFIGLFQGKLQGPEWLTGGAFGAEASVISVVICFPVALGLYRVAQKRGEVISPFWQRRASARSTG